MAFISRHVNPRTDATTHHPQNHELRSDPAALPTTQPDPPVLDYLQLPGLRNRLLLSLRSTLPEETDFALEVLLAASYDAPELDTLGGMTGFVEPLLDLIESYRTPGPFEHHALQPVRRRALESALVLRNLLGLEANLSTLPANHPRLLSLVLRALQLPRLDFDHEFVSLMLDVLDSLSSGHLVRLDQPLQPSYSPPSSSSSSSPSPSSPPALLLSELPCDYPILPDWSLQLLRGLEQLTQSFERALLLAAYRTLTSLSSLSCNHPPVTSFLLNYPDSPPSPWSPSLDRALVLLALPDVELLISVLDFLYVVTTIQPIVHAICTLHRNICPILKLLLSHLHHHRLVWNEPPKQLPHPQERWYFQPAPPSETLQLLLELDSHSPSINPSHRLPDPNAPAPAPAPAIAITRTAPQTLTMSEVHQILLNESQMKEVMILPEPRRAQVWMSRAFEACPGAEVQQVTLWLAYKTQFEHLQGNTKFGQSHPYQMIAPAEAIKLTSDVFPNALPSVTEHKNGDKKFVISGMRVRPKKHVSIWKCNWKDCSKNPLEEDNSSFTTAAAAGGGGVSAHAERLYQHITKAHIAPRATKCHWLTCTYQASNRSELLYHIRTHIPSIPPSNKRTPTQKANKNQQTESIIPPPSDSPKLLPFKSYVHQRWETPNSGTHSPETPTHQAPDLPVGQLGGGAIGIGFVSLLVLRNLIHCVSDALNKMVKPTHHHPTNQSNTSMQMDDELIIHPNANTSTPHQPDGALDQSQPTIINLAQLISGFSPKTNLDDGDGDHCILSLTHQNDLSGGDNGATQDATAAAAATEVYGNGFIEKTLLEFVLNDPHLHNIGVDLLKKISSISQKLYLVSHH